MSRRTQGSGQLAEFTGVSLSDRRREAMPVRALLVTPDRRAAALIAELLQATWSDGLVVAHARRLSDATNELLDHAVGCVLLALERPDERIAAVEQIRTAAPDVPIVVLASDGDGDEDEAVEAVQAGAQDYLVLSDLSPALLRRSLRHAIERKRLEAQLAHRALHDPLTGLPNRALFLDRLGVALDRSRRNDRSIAVLFLDVDNFKDVNDSLGHGAGDRLLAGLADRLQSMLRPMDTVARFGGDEFTFLFEDLAGDREVVLIAERIRRALSDPIHLEEDDITVAVSIGITVVTDPGNAPENVIREADAAMYRAKELGRSRYELYDESSRRRAVARIELEGALRQAVHNAQLRLHFQPTVSLTGAGGVVGLEALLRWQHPEHGLMMPCQFLPLAEETGLIVPIGRHALERALRQLAGWRAHEPDLSLSVNMSARQLGDPRLVSIVSDALAATPVDPEAVFVEVGEAVVALDLEGASRALHGLRALGVRIAIDDFGTGSSSLSTLKRLPIDVIKLHQSLVGGLGRDRGDEAIVHAIVELGHAFGVDVIAEGVETDVQLRRLRELRCDAAQGFLFGRPAPTEEVHALLTRAGDAVSLPSGA
jgi:diguanylate cyclase (GGDEF)-like protein